jgi:hypothetical protein
VDPNEAKRDSEDNEPRLDDLEFWHKLIALITSVIEEDKNSYGPVLNQFPNELNMAEVCGSKQFCYNDFVLMVLLQGFCSNDSLLSKLYVPTIVF